MWVERETAESVKWRAPPERPTRLRKVELVMLEERHSTHINAEPSEVPPNMFSISTLLNLNARFSAYIEFWPLGLVIYTTFIRSIPSAFVAKIASQLVVASLYYNSVPPPIASVMNAVA